VSRLGRVPARDLGPLRQEGYAIAYAEGFDMFPQTPHLQAVVLLER
jgi:23S rRNA (uracil1939-C5)-methyltransferase